ncbi:MAG: TRAP transporter small permease [Hyphomicrobiaceae bacterium]|nr:TRAP transporter small permease [Hyphomicrobiaceae bacterium]
MQHLSDRVTRIEESILALLLASITIITFTQVIARYVFNSGWGGALELTRILFAWMILFGMSYGVKVGSHLGVDAFVRLFPKPVFRATALFGALACLLYGVILLSSDWMQAIGANTRGGAIDYWQKMYKIGIGLDDLTYPDAMREALGIRQERVHRWIAYIMLPLGLALFAFRSAQALIDILRGKRETIIASHEAEDLVAENKDILKD